MKVLKLGETTYAVLNERSTAGYPRYHIVKYTTESITCTCEDYQRNHHKKPNYACKHIKAVFRAYGVDIESYGDNKLSKWIRRDKV